MNLSIQNLLPVPLAANPRQSAIWEKSISWGAGESIFVRAPSGTGKTTLIHTLYGLRSDYTGDIFWDDVPAKKIKPAGWAALRSKPVSVILQDMRLMPELTALENLEIKRLLANTIEATEIKVWMARLGLSKKMDAPAQTLSYGEQQRLAIMRALLQPFTWLLMDEPFSHLDEVNKMLAAELIDEVSKRNGATILMADLDDNNYFRYTQKLLL